MNEDEIEEFRKLEKIYGEMRLRIVAARTKLDAAEKDLRQLDDLSAEVRRILSK